LLKFRLDKLTPKRGDQNLEDLVKKWAILRRRYFTKTRNKKPPEGGFLFLLLLLKRLAEQRARFGALG
jgi:hypothetical protein